MAITSLSVLIVDDSPVMRKITSRMLRECGLHKVESAQNGLEGLT